MHAYLLTVSPDWVNPARVVIGSILDIDPEATVLVYTLDASVVTAIDVTFSGKKVECTLLEDMQFTYGEWFSDTYAKPRYMTLRISALDHLLATTSVSKVLYLDADTLPMAGMLGIWQERTKGAAILAVRDAGRNEKDHYLHMDNPDDVYWFDRFNGGVMLFDLDVVRDMYPEGLQLTRDCYCEYRLADQEFLFDKFKDKIEYLPYLYNYFGDPRSPQALRLDYMLAGLVYATEFSKIIHFVGAVKPWSPTFKLHRHITSYHRILTVPYFLYYDRCMELSHLLDGWFISNVKTFYNNIGSIGRSLHACCAD